MAAPILPYYANPATLPAPLPTVEDIESAGELLGRGTCRRIVGIGEHFVVKYGRGVDLIEGETMWYLQQTSVPSPCIYAAFEDQTSRKKYLIMERIKGRVLSSEWENMNQAQKEALASKLREILLGMRRLRSPRVFCSVGGKKMSDGLFRTEDPSKPLAGPFDTEDALNEAMIERYCRENRSKARADFYTAAFKEVYQGHPPIFTHGDLQRKNIMIRDNINNGTELELVLIDWETGGWYPSYWEYARAIFAGGHWHDDWYTWVGRVLEPAFNEYCWMNMLLLDIFC